MLYIGSIEEENQFYVMSNISDHVTLVQLMNLLGNINHARIVVTECISDQSTKTASFINEIIKPCFGIF